jgi:iron(III) transport system ATP-binding protein
MELVLNLRGISQAYGRHQVVRELSLQLEAGQIGCLLGESGCGKTSVLRTIAGFEPLLAGEIHIAGQLVSRSEFSMAADQRQVGMVFQDYALFPHLTISDNIAFGLKRVDKAYALRRVEELLQVVGLDRSGDKYPHELSGGQQQRVALARALAPQPQLLLLDEPFSNLDVTLRERLSLEVRDILKQQGTTALMVTHNQHEAFAMADLVGVMRAGEIQQWDTAYNLYHHPANPYVANFVGEGVLLPGVVGPDCHVETALGVLEGLCCIDSYAGKAVKVLIRPEDIVYDAECEPNAEVLRCNFRGPNILYTLCIADGSQLQMLMPSTCDHQPGNRIGIRPQVEHLVLFPAL